MSDSETDQNQKEVLVKLKYKHKSGSLKRKEQEKSKLNAVGKDPKQLKVSNYFIKTNTNLKTSEEEGLLTNTSNVDKSDKVINQNVLEKSSLGSTTSKQIIIRDANDKESTEHDTNKTTISSPEGAQSSAENKNIHREDKLSFPNDKALYDCNSFLTEDNIRLLLLQGPCQPQENDMPNCQFEKSSTNKPTKRHFSSFYYLNKNSTFGNVKSLWLAYSPRKNYAYCHFCWLFGNKEAKKSSWYSGFTDWSHITESAKIHSRSKNHIRCSIAASTFLKKLDIGHTLNKQISEEARKWREILTILCDVIKTLAALGIGFRGHTENWQNESYPGIYLTIVKLIARHCPVLKNHLESASRNKYLSKTITNELIAIISEHTKNYIISECKSAKFFSLLADSTTDVAHLDQMALMVRYVVINKREVTIKESFLSFARMDKGDATYISNVLIEMLFKTYGFDRNNMCGQGYDGANVMSGSRGGVQEKIKEFLGKEIFAPYVHCTAHQLNLVLCHATEENASPNIKVFFATIQKIYNYFAHSHRRWGLLLTKSNKNLYLQSVYDDDIVEEDKEDEDYSQPSTSSGTTSKTRPLRLKSLSTTRWAARLKAVEALKMNFEAIVESLQEEIERDDVSGEDMMKANALMTSMNWQFYLNLLWWESVLQIINIAQTILQKKAIDLFIAQTAMERAIENLEKLRSEKVYSDFIIKSKMQWEKFGFENPNFSRKRKRIVKKMPGENAEHISLSEEDQHKIGYYEALDTMLNEIRERKNSFTELNNTFGFLKASTLKTISPDELTSKVEHLLKTYDKFFTINLKHELISFIDTYFSGDYNSDQRLEQVEESSVLDYLNFIVKMNLEECFSEVTVLFRIFLTLPISTASVERVMSSLKRIKEFRRSTLTEERLNDFAILFIEREVANHLEIAEIINNFAESKARRGFIS